jgi:hypothetical protein
MLPRTVVIADPQTGESKSYMEVCRPNTTPKPKSAIPHPDAPKSDPIKVRETPDLQDARKAQGDPVHDAHADGYRGSRPAPQGEVTLPENRTGHIFRNAEGHLADTAANRHLLTDVANSPATRLGTDVHGNTWHAQTRPDGSQVWVQVRNNQVVNGGVNATPRQYNPQSGLSAPEPPRGGN